MTILIRAIAGGIVGAFTLAVLLGGLCLTPIYLYGRARQWWRRTQKSSNRKAVR